MPSAVIAISGASGARYGVRLIQALVDSNWSVNLIISREGAINLDLECGITPVELANKYGVRAAPTYPAPPVINILPMKVLLQNIFYTF